MNTTISVGDAVTITVDEVPEHWMRTGTVTAYDGQSYTVVLDDGHECEVLPDQLRLTVAIDHYDVIQVGSGDAESAGYAQEDAGRIAVQYKGRLEWWANSIIHARQAISAKLGRTVRLRSAYSAGSEDRWVPEWAEED